MIPGSLLPNTSYVRCLAVLALSCLAASTFAQDGKVYKIINPDGSVSYSDKPPVSKGTSAKQMELGPDTSGIQSMTPEEIAEANARAKARLEDMERERQEAAARRAKEEEKKAAEQQPQEVYVPVASDPWLSPRPRPRPLPGDGRPVRPQPKDPDRPRMPPPEPPPAGDLKK